MGELRNRFAKNVDALRLERLKMRELLRETAGAALVPCLSAAEPESCSMVACVMCCIFLPAKTPKNKKPTCQFLWWWDSLQLAKLDF